MKYLIVLALAAVAQARHSHIEDTSEVTAARTAHLAEHAKAAARVNRDVLLPVVRYYVIPSPAPVHHLASGPQDTPAVSAAKAAHYYEYAKTAAQLGAHIPDVYRSYAPVPVITHDGYLIDTPEVAAARSAHLAEHARQTGAAVAAAAAAPAFRAADPYAEYYRAYYNYYYPSLTRSVYSGHHAEPVVLPSGYLADTPEVAHAKAVHLYRHYQEATRH